MCGAMPLRGTWCAALPARCADAAVCSCVEDRGVCGRDVALPAKSAGADLGFMESKAACMLVSAPPEA